MPLTHVGGSLPGKPDGVEALLAAGAGAGLIGGLTLYVIVWWIRRAVTATRPRSSGVGSGYEDAPRANSAA
ncbi:hypothetical protein [Kitasatospora sp. NPDC087314]|uniref:hypothetical protein n=1 Tax=Kitasatospora sp. NPDC087314 TaxID=3364068 RepID=UPI003802E702